MPEDLEGFVTLIPVGINYIGPTILTQVNNHQKWQSELKHDKDQSQIQGVSDLFDCVKILFAEQW